MLSKRQLGQRRHRERERLERPPSLPRFFPSLTPSRRQRAQMEHAKSKRPLKKLHVICEEVLEVAMPVLGSSTTTNQPDSPSNFVLEEESNLEAGVEICMP